MESVLCLPTISNHGGCPGVWLIYPVENQFFLSQQLSIANNYFQIFIHIFKIPFPCIYRTARCSALFECVWEFGNWKLDVGTLQQLLLRHTAMVPAWQHHEAAARGSVQLHKCSIWRQDVTSQHRQHRRIGKGLYIPITAISCFLSTTEWFP